MKRDEIKRRIKELEDILATHQVSVDLKTKGDIHIVNVKRFFNRWVAKSDPLRDAVKGVVFGRECRPVW